MIIEEIEKVYSPGEIILYKKPDGGESKVVEEAPDEGEIDDDIQVVEKESEKDNNGLSKNANDKFVEINRDKGDIVFLSVTNSGTQPIKIGSHFNFIEANKSLQFDRSQAFGMRLNIPSGDSIEFEPKSTKVVPLVKISGTRFQLAFQI